MPLPRAPEKLADVLDRDVLTKLSPSSAVLTEQRSSASAATAQTAQTAYTPPRSLPAATSRQAVMDKSSKPKAPALLDNPSTTSPITVATAVPNLAPQSPAKAATQALERPNPKRRSPRTGTPKLFVLDTNVLMHDPTSLFRFEEHDVYLPMTTLEELDNNKKGMTEVARNARQASRWLDQLASSKEAKLDDGIALNALGNDDAQGKLYFQTKLNTLKLPDGLPAGKADNMILAVVGMLKETHPGREVVLVTKDINMRIKSRALGLNAEDYTNDKALEDSDVLYTGTLQLPENFWDAHSKGMESWQQSGNTYYRVKGPLVAAMMVNQFVYSEAQSALGGKTGGTPLLARVRELRSNTAVLQTLRDYSHVKHSVWGIHARNREQNFAFNLLMDPEVDFVTLTGQAGTGKTLMTLAAGLAQVLDERRYNEIIVTRVTVPVGEDIGFLPGTEEEKMGPWMGALDDNLEVLHKTDDSSGDWGRAATQDLIRSRIKIKSLNFMRGRTFLNKFVIIDEAQNLTPKQMKTLITRAGPGTKIVCLGNLAQIDTPYLTEGSSGLTYVVDRFKGWQHAGHITLARGERSRLADFASDIL
jgi:PhoH-like ATPase